MNLKPNPQRPVAVWWICLLVFAVILAGCGVATESTPDDTDVVTSEESEQVTDTSSEETEETAVEETESQPESSEQAIDNETSSAPEQELASISTAMCHAATPENDQLMALLQPTQTIAQVSADDWSKGPADAAVTVVEYGDFQ